jgi:hypothetical protein
MGVFSKSVGLKIWFHRGSQWVEIKLSAEEQNARAVVFEVAEAAGGGFDALDFGVQSLRHSVGDVILLKAKASYQ